MLKFFFIGLFCLYLFSFPNSVFASNNQSNIQCPDRYLTLINPVRSRQLWIDKTLQPIQNQYNLILNNHLPATWLIQDDVLFDAELLNTLKSFDNQQEFGLLLEISDQLAKNARVTYPPFVPWYDPKAVFLSGYTQSERRLLIDKMFKDFFQTFGFYPKSVGAWWIDSYSLNYLKEKYRIKSALIVADQKNTDNYGIWGQWWGVPYYPSKANVLIPASNITNKQPVVILQWAQRDPILAYGSDYHSSYSLQANDYTLLGKDTNYFEDLVNVYLDCQNSVGQITVGLETGMESIKSLPEYENQLKFLKTISSLNPVTMTQFAEKFREAYPEFPHKIVLNYQEYIWKLNTGRRDNDKLNEHILYQQNLAFQDYFVSDQKDFLDRKLPINTSLSSKEFLSPIYIIILISWALLLIIRKQFRVLFVGILFVVASFGLVLKSNFQLGWIVYYGLVVENLAILQLIVTFLGFLVIFIVDRFLRPSEKIYLYLIPLTFGIDTIIQHLRFSFISNKYYLGIMGDALRFIGISFEKPFSISLVNQDFPAYQALSLLHFDYNLIWQNIWFSVIIYPLFHVFLTLVLWYILKFIPKKIKYILISILLLLFVIYLLDIWQANPRAAIISATIKP